jgi:hypothetical protein
MRLKACVLVIPLIIMLAVTSPSHAATETIVQTIPGLSQPVFQGEFGFMDVLIVPFNPALGTLQDVTVDIIGTYVPGILFASGSSGLPPTVTLTTTLFIDAGNRIHPQSRQQLVMTQLDIPLVSPCAICEGFVAIGEPTTIDHTFDFGQLTPPETNVFQYFFQTRPGIHSEDDLTTFTGQAVVTYTYDAPSPTTALLFAIGLLGLAWSRRRSA